ncbi:hypothetical protein [Asticcacaulis excentricus]|uniref:Uncharacterized protein n=1 Tax=Asticcacaulis excentricus (strain ATCC 15261 / DSM 4724 / KCTC 12464 / NCIMB 9791 / VKM B-1370 / CB 48) TaxID=573065 RepID=E8RKL8_ASTEC|nr:hypothetical protein [Asticcacaulis excentricus]ADU13552.1 hypothetical protein Astex_1889 [Asticcacaulis excentricus CB 48]
MKELTRKGFLAQGLASGLALMAAGVARAQKGPMLAYADGMKEGWWIGGWAKQTPAVPLEDQKPVEITMAAWNVFTFQTWQKLNGPDFKTLTLLVHGGPKGKQEVSLRLRLGEKAYESQVTLKGVKGKWVRYDVPIKDLKVKDGQFDTIELRNASAESLEPFYVNFVILQ